MISEAPLDQDTLFLHIKSVLEGLLEDVDLSQLSLDTDLKADLHVDSTIAMEVAFRLCKSLKRDVPFERWFAGQVESNDYSIRALTAFLQEHL